VPAYVILQVDVTDTARWDEYKVEASPTILAAGGRYVIRGGATLPLEGEAPPGRTVVIEFASRAAADEWYHGEGYTRARALRNGAGAARVYVIDGVD
jgi:uncharacterized protein (DUF1330 family)